MQFNKLFAVATLLVGALLAGCQTTDPYTGEQQASKSTKYGLGGVLAGAAVGAVADGGSGALKGAVIGGVAGAGYGYYMDRQESILRAELQGTGVQIHRQGDELKLIMPSNITFDSGKSDIKSAFYPVLSSVSKVFKEYDRNLIEVVGYTDSTGGDKINVPLSQDRADSVARYIALQGVGDKRITAYGRGSEDPIASNKTVEGRAKNRRVEINIIPVP